MAKWNSLFHLSMQVTSLQNIQVLAYCKIMCKFLLFCRARPAWQTRNDEVLNNHQITFLKERNKEKACLCSPPIWHKVNRHKCFAGDANVQLLTLTVKFYFVTSWCFLVMLSKYPIIVFVNLAFILNTMLCAQSDTPILSNSWVGDSLKLPLWQHTRTGSAAFAGARSNNFQL